MYIYTHTQRHFYCSIFIDYFFKHTQTHTHAYTHVKLQTIAYGDNPGELKIWGKGGSSRKKKHFL